MEPFPAETAHEVVEVHAQQCSSRPRDTILLEERRLTVTESRARSRTTELGRRSTASSADAPVLPYNPEAERALLGASLFSKAACAIAATVPVDAYYVATHGHIARAITTLHLDDKAVDPVTVADWLRDAGLLEDVGGGAELVALQHETPNTHGAARYAEIVVGDWRRRRTIYIAYDLTAAARGGTDTSPHIAELADLQAHAGVDELALENMAAAYEDTFDEQPTILARADDQHLLYENAVNVLQSEPTVGKSMLALIACAEVIFDDGHALYLDHEDTPKRIARRLVDTLGLSVTQLVERFHYKRVGSLSPKAIAGLPRLATDVKARIIVIDGLAEALAAQDYDENVGTDVAAWWNTIARPLADTGACVLILDHVTKSKENRGRWARGSGHKLAAVDGVAYSLDTIDPFSRDRAGRLKLTIAKDRPACVGATGDIAAVIDLTPLQAGGRLQWTTTTHTNGPEWQGPTDCMALVRQLFTEHPDLELARSAIAAHLKTIYDKGYRDRTVREAADRLATEGVLRMRPQGKRGTYFRLNTDAADPPEEELWVQF